VSDFEFEEDQPRVIEQILNWLNMGLMLILLAFYLGDSLVSKHIVSCLVERLTPPVSVCYYDIPIGYMVATSMVALIGVRLVIENTLSNGKLEILGHLGLGLVTLYPAYTGVRIYDDIRQCQQQAYYSDRCIGYGFEMFMSHIIISILAVCLGIWCYAVFFSQNRKLLEEEDE
jgi:hypothetical protein